MKVIQVLQYATSISIYISGSQSEWGDYEGQGGEQNKGGDWGQDNTQGRKLSTTATNRSLS